MELRIAESSSGEELMDVETFAALHGNHLAAPRSALARPFATPELSEPARSDRTAPAGNFEPAPAAPPPREVSPPVLAGPPATPAAAAALEAEIDGCTSRTHVARLAVHLARAYAPAAALFQVHRGMVERVCSEGPSSPDGELLFPTDASRLFAQVVSSGEPYRGAPPEGGLEERILRVLGRRHLQEIALLPVTLRGRVVSLLYADNGPEALGDASFAALSSVCARVSRAYQRLILERKRESVHIGPPPR
jgi:hypothetical protein